MLQVYPIFSAPCVFDSYWKVSFQGLLTEATEKNSKTCRIKRRRGNSNFNMTKLGELKIQQQQKVAAVTTTTTRTLEQCQQHQREVITLLLLKLVQKTVSYCTMKTKYLVPKYLV
jgi:hypothetical protein